MLEQSQNCFKINYAEIIGNEGKTDGKPLTAFGDEAEVQRRLQELVDKDILRCSIHWGAHDYATFDIDVPGTDQVQILKPGDRVNFVGDSYEIVIDPSNKEE
ncbi:hypothetical protein AVT69_gp275 [Pseudomonas phage PhiPA3]|uniref:Uncharacterized protein 277 n=1 Tax=Pseudomonas phage PhiPA3 TaxID=998086 RepID=F8SJB3_BPPA3|nr:hypothetical protein AVT69_gp275 [Pseudomonas phage PhiPA3]AEH03700.1 hypothetical protein [Pseudomonas phage PhiPA3]